MTFFQYIIQDFAANKKNTKGKVITMLYRLASYVSRNKISRIIFFPYLAFYRLVVEWIFGVELPWSTKVGKGLRIFHGQATVINKAVVIGKNCTIRQSTSIGNIKADGDSPAIGDNVEIGANVCIVGAITIGDNVIIGAGSVVVKSIPSNSVAVGNPARVIKTMEDRIHSSQM